MAAFVRATGLPLRAALAALGAAAVLFAGMVLVVWPQPATIERLAARIVEGEGYKAEDLDRLAPDREPIGAVPRWRAGVQRAAAIVRLRQAETAIAEGRRIDIDRHLDGLAHRLSGALAVSPADAFLWLALFWRDSHAQGFEPARLRLLAMSYATGPNEGWVGLRRSPIALALFPRLPPVLQEAATAEFVGLVDAGFSGEMASVLIGPGWPAREALLPRLSAVAEPRRKAFARTVYDAGVDVEVPGIERPSGPPWRR